MNHLNLEEFAHRLQDMHQSLAQMQQHAGELPSQQQRLETMATAFQELSFMLEELQVANEELHVSNEAFSEVYQAVEASRQRYQELFELAPDAYLVTDTYGIIQEANRAAATLLNSSQTLLIGKPLAVYIDKNKLRDFRTQLTELYQVDGVREWEINLQSLNQTSITATVRVATVRNQQSKPVSLGWLLRDVTNERHRTEAKLVEDIVANLPGTIYRAVLHPDGKRSFLFISSEIRELTGLEPNEVMINPECWFTAIHPDDRSQVERILTTAYETLQPVQHEFRIVTTSGQVKWVQDNSRYFRIDNGDVVVNGMTLEIPERKPVQTALCQHEEFKALVENAPDVIERFNQERRHIYVNPAVEKAIGRLPSEFIGKTNRELGMSEPNLSLWERALERVFETGQEEQIEFSVATSNGLKYYQTRFVPEFTADSDLGTGRTPVSILGISRDITEPKLALDALRESELRFRQLAENIHDVFWITSPDFTQTIYMSPAYHKIWGRSCESVYEEPFSWLEAVHPEDRDYVNSFLKELIEGKYEQEYRIVRPDGSIRWIRDRGFPVHDEQGRMYRIAGIAEDISHYKQAELEIYKMLQRERELSELKSQFISMTSHEFRTPLTTIQSSAQLLERYRDRLSQEKQQSHLHRIQLAVERMTQMLNDILIIGKADSGKLEFHPTRIDLVQFCRELVEELQQNAFSSHSCDNVIVFTSQCPYFPTNIDEKLLRHILSNLLSNAIKYSPDSSNVQFDLTCLDSKAVFKIQDQGIGIPSEDLPHLFESFHRATNVGTIQGTGLGLAIVKECVELHKGEITFSSKVGQGTTFTVMLPLINEALSSSPCG